MLGVEVKMRVWLTTDSSGVRWLWREEPTFSAGKWDVEGSRTLGDAGMPCGYDVADESGEEVERTLPWPVTRGELAIVEVELVAARLPGRLAC